MGFILSRDDTGVPVAAFNSFEDLLKFTTLQKKWRADFNGNALNTDRWDLVQQGSGQTLTVSGGRLTITSGTTANAETIIMSKETFIPSVRVIMALYQSAKAANVEVHMELVSVDPVTGQPDGKNVADFFVDNSNTNGNYVRYGVQYDGGTRVDSSNQYISTPVTSNGIREIEIFPDECWFHTRPVDSASSRQQSFVKQMDVPDPNAVYKLRIRVKNNGTPGANISAYFYAVSVVDFAELTTEITAGRGITSSGQAIAVIGAGGSMTCYVYGRNLGYTDTATNLTAGQTLLGTARDVGPANGGTQIYYTAIAMVTTDQAGTLYIEQSRDNSTWRITEVVNVPAGSGISAPAVTLKDDIVMRYVRFRYVNGATATGTFQIDTSYVCK